MTAVMRSAGVRLWKDLAELFRLWRSFACREQKPPQLLAHWKFGN